MPLSGDLGADPASYADDPALLQQLPARPPARAPGYATATAADPAGSGRRGAPSSAQRCHLNQVLSNLLTNAAKYGGDTIVISASSDQERVSISIADNGRGVEPDFVQHLFERFSRSAAVRDARKPGTGLGLYIVRDLLAANDGTIRYAPSQSGGAEFTMSLCAARGAPASGGG